MVYLFFGLALLGASSMYCYYVGLFLPRLHQVAVGRGLAGGYGFGNDFYQIWFTSQECVRTRCDLYSQEMTRQIQIGLYGRPLDFRPSDPIDRRAFPYPAFTDVLLWPAARFPFTVVRVAVVCVLCALTGASVVLWLRALSWRVRGLELAIILLLVLGSYPLLEAIYAVQVGLLVAFFLAAALLALRKERLLLCGVLLALTTIKPQVSLLPVLYLHIWSAYNWRRGRNLWLGFFSTELLLIGAALLIWPRWIQSWVQQIVRYHGYTPAPLVHAFVLPLVGSHLAGPLSYIIIASLMIVAAWLCWTHRLAADNSIEFWLTLSLLLGITTIALLPGQALYDHVILLPGIFLLARERCELPLNLVGKSLFATGVIVVLWPWISAFALLVLRPWLPSAVFYSKAVFALPLRPAAAFPVVVLALLTLTMRQKQSLQRSLSVIG